MTIKITLKAPEISQIEVDGETIRVDWDTTPHSGDRFRAVYRGQFLNGPTLATLRNGVRRIRDDEATKAAKEQARKEAAKNPLPAVALRGEKWIERVGVRGRHATSKEALVTFANGSKGSVDPAYLLRDLTDGEYARVEKAVEALVAARTGAKGSESKDHWTLVDQYTLALDASYDTTSDRWVAEYDGQRFGGSAASSVREAIEDYLLDRDYPFTIREGRVVDTRQDDDGKAKHRGYWASAEDAQRYLDAYAVVSACTDELITLLREFRFDLSVFED